MLYAIALIFFVLWLVGLAVSYTVGGLVHILLGLAILAVIIQFFRGRRGTTTTTTM